MTAVLAVAAFLAATALLVHDEHTNPEELAVTTTSAAAANLVADLVLAVLLGEPVGPLLEGRPVAVVAEVEVMLAELGTRAAGEALEGLRAARAGVPAV